MYEPLRHLYGTHTLSAGLRERSRTPGCRPLSMGRCTTTSPPTRLADHLDPFSTDMGGLRSSVGVALSTPFHLAAAVARCSLSFANRAT